jgi:hypothetical protein
LGLSEEMVHLTGLEKSKYLEYEMKCTAQIDGQEIRASGNHETHGAHSEDTLAFSRFIGDDKPLRLPSYTEKGG